MRTQESEKQMHYFIRFDWPNIEVRTEEGDSGNDIVITGIGVPYDSDSEPIDGEFIETFDRNCIFDRGPHGALLLYGHDRNALLARETNGSLQLRSTDVGLEFRAVLPDTQLARDVIEMIRRGLITGASVGFWPTEEEFKPAQRPGDHYRIKIKRAILYEISLVATPAYMETSTEEERAQQLRSLYANNIAGATATAESEEVEFDDNLYQMQLEEMRYYVNE